VSFDLAVWEGDRPGDDRAASAEYEALFDRYLDSDPVEPTPRIAAYTAALADRPLNSEASGPIAYLTMSWSTADELSAQAARLAEDHGLNCFDPQSERLRTPWGRPWRFELTSANHPDPLRDPGPDQIRRVVTHLSAGRCFAVLSRADGWYVQVGYGEEAGTRHGWYALERRDGTPDQHYRTETSDIQEVIQAFTGFLEDDPALRQRFVWHPYAV
jgi:hypothetical protein